MKLLLLFLCVTMQGWGQTKPIGIMQCFLGADGQPAAGGAIHTYRAGTVIPLATWADSTLAIPQANPILLDSRGCATMYIAAPAAQPAQKPAKPAPKTLPLCKDMKVSGYCIVKAGEKLGTLEER